MSAIFASPVCGSHADTWPQSSSKNWYNGRMFNVLGRMFLVINLFHFLWALLLLWRIPCCRFSLNYSDSNVRFNCSIFKYFIIELYI